MKRMFLLLRVSLVAAFVLAGFCGQAYAMKADPNRLVSGNNDFAIQLYGQLMEKEGNLFLSPYSISTALGMVYAGAEGKTAEEMAAVLNFDMDREQLNVTFGHIIDQLNSRSEAADNELNVANAVWVEKSFELLQTYLGTVKGSYDAEAKDLDFAGDPEASRVTINKWVEDRTKEKIKDLIAKGTVDKSTRLVLTNAIYFKAQWMHQFSDRVTKDGDFTKADGQVVQVPMMSKTDMYGYSETDDFQILEMPYAGRLLSMVIFLPKEKDGLKDFEKELTFIKTVDPLATEEEDSYPLAQKLGGWMEGIGRKRVAVTFPKFKITSSFELSEILKAMGMNEAFSGGADFSGMTGKKELYISAVIHKAFVAVDEKGTEAAAATAVVMKAMSAPRMEEPVVFKADHPFFYVIRDIQTNSILFMGRVADPGAK